jgi:2',3'-cyclic-nucleotide 2'-phosphodiesterase (5'-nucleotidase family)
MRLLRFSWPVLLALGLLHCQPRYYLLNQSPRPTLLAVTDTSARDVDPALARNLEAYLEPFADSLNDVMNTVLVKSTQRLRKGEPESELGNLMADVLMEIGREKANRPIDLAMTNSGGIRADLPAGTITRGNAFEVMPFDNAVVLLTLPGPVMKQFIDFIAHDREPQAGLKLVIDKPTGAVASVLVNGQPLDLARTYTVITTDYVAQSSQIAPVLKNAATYQTLDLLYRDALIEYLRRRGQRGETLNLQKDGRTIYQ